MLRLSNVLIFCLGSILSLVQGKQPKCETQYQNDSWKIEVFPVRDKTQSYPQNLILSDLKIFSQKPKHVLQLKKPHFKSDDILQKTGLSLDSFCIRASARLTATFARSSLNVDLHSTRSAFINIEEISSILTAIQQGYSQFYLPQPLHVTLDAGDSKTVQLFVCTGEDDSFDTKLVFYTERDDVYELSYDNLAQFHAHGEYIRLSYPDRLTVSDFQQNTDCQSGPWQLDLFSFQDGVSLQATTHSEPIKTLGTRDIRYCNIVQALNQYEDGLAQKPLVARFRSELCVEHETEKQFDFGVISTDYSLIIVNNQVQYQKEASNTCSFGETRGVALPCGCHRVELLVCIGCENSTDESSSTNHCLQFGDNITYNKFSYDPCLDVMHDETKELVLVASSLNKCFDELPSPHVGSPDANQIRLNIREVIRKSKCRKDSGNCSDHSDCCDRYYCEQDLCKPCNGSNNRICGKVDSNKK